MSVRIIEYKWPEKAVKEKEEDAYLLAHCVEDVKNPWLGIVNKEGNPGDIMFDTHRVPPGNMLVGYVDRTLPKCTGVKLEGKVKFMETGTYGIDLVAGVNWPEDKEPKDRKSIETRVEAPGVEPWPIIAIASIIGLGGLTAYLIHEKLKK